MSQGLWKGLMGINSLVSGLPVASEEGKQVPQGEILKIKQRMSDACRIFWFSFSPPPSGSACSAVRVLGPLGSIMAPRVQDSVCLAQCHGGSRVKNCLKTRPVLNL